MNALTGHYRLHPGSAQPIVGTRPVLGADRLSQLLHGQPQAGALARLGHVFSLCSHAHQHAGRLAWAAAQSGQMGQLAQPDPAAWAHLRWATLRDHLRSMALEWPTRLGGEGAAALAWLQTCPLPLAGPAPQTEAETWAAIQSFRSWLETQVLGLDADHWLADHQEPEALARWCLSHPAQPVALHAAPVLLLAQWHARTNALHAPGPMLDVLDTTPAVQRSHLHTLAEQIDADPGFVQHPLWQGRPAETGPWTRLHLRQTAARPTSAWARLAARWLELVTLAAAPPPPAAAAQDPLLAGGALALGGGRAIAWCEMARGLLLHAVQLQADGTVQRYRVLAPTEWNFHPQGALARALSALAPDAVADAQGLAAAFDPCVDCTVVTPADALSPSRASQEPSHA